MSDGERGGGGREKRRYLCKCSEWDEYDSETSSRSRFVHVSVHALKIVRYFYPWYSSLISVRLPPCLASLLLHSTCSAVAMVCAKAQCVFVWPDLFTNSFLVCFFSAFRNSWCVWGRMRVVAEKRERDGGERDRERERGGRGERERDL